MGMALQPEPWKILSRIGSFLMSNPARLGIMPRHLGSARCNLVRAESHVHAVDHCLTVAKDVPTVEWSMRGAVTTASLNETAAAPANARGRPAWRMAGAVRGRACRGVRRRRRCANARKAFGRRGLPGRQSEPLAGRRFAAHHGPPQCRSDAANRRDWLIVHDRFMGRE